MAAITTGLTIRDGTPLSNAYREIIVETAASADSGDTFTITMANYGCIKFLGMKSWVHTTVDSVVVSDSSTTSVTDGVLTVTLDSGGLTDKKRIYLIYMR
jgi:hypothetical protein